MWRYFDRKAPSKPSVGALLQITLHHIPKDSKKGKGKVAPLYRHWGSVQAVRPIGGVEI